MGRRFKSFRIYETVTFMYRSIRTGSSPEPYVKVLENSEVQVPRRPCGTRSPISGNWTQNIENAELRCVFFQVISLYFFFDRPGYSESLLYPGVISLIIIGSRVYRIVGFSAGVLCYVGNKISSDAAPQRPNSHRYDNYRSEPYTPRSAGIPILTSSASSAEGGYYRNCCVPPPDTVCSCRVCASSESYPTPGQENVFEGACPNCL